MIITRLKIKLAKAVICSIPESLVNILKHIIGMKQLLVEHTIVYVEDKIDPKTFMADHNNI
jgi:hypothetical protein